MIKAKRGDSESRKVGKIMTVRAGTLPRSGFVHLASIWTIRLLNRCCDICKDFRFEIPEIHSETVEKVQKW